MRISSSLLSTPSSKPEGADLTVRSETARSSFCRWMTASGSAPVNEVRRQSDCSSIHSSSPATLQDTMIQAVIFDFNGVLVDDETVHFELFREVLGQEGVE